MSVTRKLANGSVLKIGNGASSETFTDIPGLIEFKLGASTRPAVDVTGIGDSAHKVLPGLRSVETFSFKAYFDSTDSVQNGLWTDFDAGTLRNFKGVLTDNGAEVQVVACYITKLDIDPLTVDGAVTFSGELAVDGLVTRS